MVSLVADGGCYFIEYFTDRTRSKTSSAIGTQSFARTMAADGTEYMRVPLSGEYLRVQLAATGTLTPTVQATYRN